jgi:hypothetical protein
VNINKAQKNKVIFLGKSPLHKVISGDVELANEILHLKNEQDVIDKLIENRNYSVLIINKEDNDYPINKLLKILNNKSDQYLPVIVLSNMVDDQIMKNYIDNGVHYILKTPCNLEIFQSFMKRALKDHEKYSYYISKYENKTIQLITHSASFRIQNLKEAHELADWLASICERESCVVGFIELLVNAIEHGNLNIGYNEKSIHLKKGGYLNYIINRLEESDYKDKFVDVKIEKSDETLNVTIKDQGAGFDYTKYLEVDKKRMFDAHGRGIVMATKLYLDKVEYKGNGNEVYIEAKLRKPIKKALTKN